MFDMARLILATGIDDLDKRVEEHYKGSVDVESVTYLQALTLLSLTSGDTVLLGDSLSTSGSGPNGMVIVVEHLRKRDVRVVYFGVARKDDPFIQTLIHRGVYDLLLVSDEIVLEDIFARVDHPATYGDVAHLLSTTSTLETGQMRRRQALSWRTREDEELADEQPTGQDSESSFNRVRTGWIRPKAKQPDVVKTGPKVITVTGLPGSGVSFVALHLALSYAKNKQVTLVEASQRPIYTKWLNGPVGDRGAQQLAAKKVPERRWMVADNLRVLPAHSDERGPTLRSLLSALNGLETDVVILDAALDDVRSVGEPVEVIVIPPDIVKAEHVRDIETRLVVVNMAPKVLPVELAEYGQLWSGVKVASCPYVPEQALAVMTGRAVDHVREVVETWMQGF